MSEKKSLPYANKNLGQHFLRSQKVIDAICNDIHSNVDGIIEVGPGPGILTEFISKHEKPYHVIEMDKRFEIYLEQWVKNEHIHFGDALDFDIQGLCVGENWQHTWLVSNLPYNVASPLLIKFLQIPQIKTMTLMFQKEVAEKVVPKEKDLGKAMSSLFALSQNYFKCKSLIVAPPGAFFPPPKVDSLVVSFERIETPVIPLSEFNSFESFLRRLFSMKRKQIGTVLKSHYPPEQLAHAFSEIGIERNLRAETLNLEQVQILYKLLTHN